jgi:hypothetical protein
MLMFKRTDRGRRSPVSLAAAAAISLPATLLVFLATASPAPAQSEAGRPALSPTREYKAALAEGDATRAARAVLRMWRGRLTEDRLRGLNERLRIQSDERSVAAVVLEASRLQNSAQGSQGSEGPTGTSNEPPGDRIVRWLSDAFRPPVTAPAPTQTGSINPAVKAEQAPPAQRTPSRTRTRGSAPGNPALDYEEALLARDAARMARAAAKLTGSPVSADALRKLNEEIGIPSEEAMIESVLAAARGARQD